MNPQKTRCLGVFEHLQLEDATPPGVRIYRLLSSRKLRIGSKENTDADTYEKIGAYPGVHADPHGYP